MQKWHQKVKSKPPAKLSQPSAQQSQAPNYAAIDLGTNSCRLVIATPTPTSFRIVETFSKIAAVKRTVGALKVCSGVLAEYAPIVKSRYVATAACRRAVNCQQFLDLVKKETGLNIEIISSKEESRLAVVGCIPLLSRNIKRALVFDIGGGSTEISLARTTNSGNTFIEGFVSLPYGVVTISEAFPQQEMTDLAYDTIIERTHKILADFENKYKIREAIANQEIQIIGTSGTVTVLGAVHLNLPRYNRSAVDGISITKQDIDRAIAKIKRLGDEGRKKHPCIGVQKADLTMAGCAIIEALCSFWPIAEITVADRGIREGILLDMMHSTKKPFRRKKRKNRHPFNRNRSAVHNSFNNEQIKGAVNE